MIEHTMKARDFTDPATEDLASRHVVVLNADMVDYSRHLADDPTGTITTVELYRSIVEHEVVAGGGVLVDFVGDNFLAVFDDALVAMKAALEITTAIERRPGPLPIVFRMGLASGSVILTSDGRVFGDTVTIAARIQAHSTDGGISVADSVFRELDEPTLRFRPVGLRRLKNVAAPVMVYRFRGSEERSAPIDRRESEARIAILPLAAGGHAAEVGGAILMDVVTSLVQLPGLDVLDLRREGTGHPAVHGARYLLESGAVVSGGRVRFYLQLLDAPTVNRVWADRWESDLEELFSLQDTISDRAARALEVELIVGEAASVYRELLDRDSIFNVYHGWNELGRGSQTGLRNAIEAFEAVETASPDVATGPALAGFAYWYGVVIGLSTDVASDFARARAHAQHGMELDDPSGLSQMVVAACLLDDARSASLINSAYAGATSLNRGLSFTSLSKMPCTAEAPAGMGMVGFTLSHFSMVVPSGIALTTAISTIRSLAKSVPVVSRSTKARGRVRFRFI
jgi:class 3 adenylate cyclase